MAAVDDAAPTWDHGAMSSPSYQPHEQAWSPGPALEPDRDPYGAAPLPGTVVMAPDQQRLWAVLGHLSPLLTGLLGPLVLFMVLKDRGSFVRHHGAEALNLQITLALVSFAGVLVGGLLTLVTFGLAALVLAPVAAVFAAVVLVFQVLAAVRANQGLDCRYPLTLRLVR